MDETYTSRWLVSLVVDPTTGPVNHDAGTILHVEPWRTYQGRPLDCAEILHGITRRGANPAVGERLRELDEQGVEPVVEALTDRRGPDPVPAKDHAKLVRDAMTEFMTHPLLSDPARRSRFVRFSPEWIDLVAHISKLELPSDMTVVAFMPSRISTKNADDVEHAIASLGRDDILGTTQWQDVWDEVSGAGPTVALLMTDAHTAPGFFPSGMVLKVFLVTGPSTVVGDEDDHVRAMNRSFVGKVVPGLPERRGHGYVLVQGQQRGRSWKVAGSTAADEAEG